jgi:predicted transcriptional regulator
MTENQQTLIKEEEAAARLKREKHNRTRRMRDEALRSLGLVKVRGSVSGKTYWE